MSQTPRLVELTLLSFLLTLLSFLPLLLPSSFLPSFFLHPSSFLPSVLSDGLTGAQTTILVCITGAGEQLCNSTSLIPSLDLPNEWSCFEPRVRLRRLFAYSVFHILQTAHANTRACI